MKIKWYLYAAAIVAALLFAFGIWSPFQNLAKADKGVSEIPPKFKVDPFWPKPLPAPGGHQWVTGEPGGSCVDSKDHIITVNRGFQTGGLVSNDGTTSIPSPPVLEFDPKGNLVRAWGDPSLVQSGPNAGKNAVMPNGIHGCFVDHQDNVWIAGNADGVVQKWTHDGSQMLLQIGTKFLCDTMTGVCGATGALNSSPTLLNNPADIAVDPENGDVYIADGYGNYRVVVFDQNGGYLRQWGEPGTGPGEFGNSGHPHCVVIGKDRLVYACDRANNRIQVFEKTPKMCTGTLPNLGVCQPVRIIPVTPPSPLDQSTLRACDIDFSIDRYQTWMYDTDLGSDKVWVMNRELGTIEYGLGRAGHMAGEFIFPHTATVDSKGNLYIAETINGRRIQKFVNLGHQPGKEDDDHNGKD